MMVMADGSYASSMLYDGRYTIFVCYAHADNQSDDPRKRWLDRLLEMLRPLTRQAQFSIWSDQEIKAGENWHERIKTQLMQAKAVVLLVSPAFLASDYIATNELPVLLKQLHSSNGLLILPVLLSPSLYEETRFKYPDPRVGPFELTLGSLQAANPPSQTLIEMTEGEQQRVLIAVARRLSEWLSDGRGHDAAGGYHASDRESS